MVQGEVLESLHQNYSLLLKNVWEMCLSACEGKSSCWQCAATVVFKPLILVMDQVTEYTETISVFKRKLVYNFASIAVAVSSQFAS